MGGELIDTENLVGGRLDAELIQNFEESGAEMSREAHQRHYRNTTVLQRRGDVRVCSQIKM